VRVERVDGARVILRVPVDRVGEMLTRLAAARVRDVVWERPSLEEVFLAHYREAAR
jgi:hypothetical protein